MKLFHTSDWHLGRMLYGLSLIHILEITLVAGGQPVYYFIVSVE